MSEKILIIDDEQDVYKRQAVNCTYPKADEKEMEFVFDYAKELETCLSLIHI